MPKPRRSQKAARRRHQAKRGEVDPAEVADLKQDGTYVADDSASDAESVVLAASSIIRKAGAIVINLLQPKSPTPPTSIISQTPVNPDPDLAPDWELTEEIQAGKKRKREERDLTRDFLLGGSTSSVY
ncbi:hypothetical protein B0H17DRAFT_1152174 [Mycena rosella]|uniref:Uncharacterized protein n=1 Tax=Mycena rosella TaxID=1033263 RepID=A0AAD7BF25_MYCRO|nr:hypothetical protein B0H17DRAFT_1152174 [Mycena rosella]